MTNCLQTDTQSIYEHGISVRDNTFQLIEILETGIINNNYKLPDWLLKYRLEILQNLFPKNIIEEYTIYHDCSKPYCLVIDECGRRHFSNHADKSGQIWLSVGGSPIVAKLMNMDMIIHSIKSHEIDEFIKHNEAITLLIVGLAEIHSNAIMFGGFNSESFKIKYKQINKKGLIICHKLFGIKNK